MQSEISTVVTCSRTNQNLLKAPISQKSMHDRPSNQEINESLKSQARISLRHLLLLSFSALIASLGLLINSTGIIIGAMIIAPMMNPIVSLGYAISASDLRILLRSLFNLILSIIVVLIISYFSASLLSLRIAGSELLSRTQPSMVDLGVAICAGLAAGYSTCHKQIANTLPGVAISVALVPPLCVTGLSLFLGENASFIASNAGISADLRVGSFLLFLTNLIGITLSTILIFLLHGYHKDRRSLFGLASVTALTLLLVNPLRSEFTNLWIKSQVSDTIFKLRRERPNLFPGLATLRSISASQDSSDQVLLRIMIDLPIKKSFMSDSEEKLLRSRTQLISDAVSKRIERPVKLLLSVNPILTVTKLAN